MPLWDSEQYAAKKVKKLFVPRGTFSCHSDEAKIHAPDTIIPGSCAPQDDFYSGLEHIENYEFFTDGHIPDISSTELRKIIPELTVLDVLYSYSPKFIIPGLSKKISQYILEHRLYRPKPKVKPKILVHVCCGPDVTMPILALKEEYDLICFWYDPNIQPKKEYDKRYEAFVKVCEIEGIPYIK